MKIVGVSLLLTVLLMNATANYPKTHRLPGPSAANLRSLRSERARRTRWGGATDKTLLDPWTDSWFYAPVVTRLADAGTRLVFEFAPPTGVLRACSGRR